MSRNETPTLVCPHFQKSWLLWYGMMTQVGNLLRYCPCAHDTLVPESLQPPSHSVGASSPCQTVLLVRLYTERLSNDLTYRAKRHHRSAQELGRSSSELQLCHDRNRSCSSMRNSPMLNRRASLSGSRSVPGCLDQ